MAGSDIIWTPGQDEADPMHLVGTGAADDDSFSVILCGGGYGETKEEGRPVRVRKGVTERMVVRSTAVRRGQAQGQGPSQNMRIYFGPCSEPGVWRPFKYEGPFSN